MMSRSQRRRYLKRHQVAFTWRSLWQRVLKRPQARADPFDFTALAKTFKQNTATPSSIYLLWGLSTSCETPAFFFIIFRSQAYLLSWYSDRSRTILVFYPTSNQPDGMPSEDRMQHLERIVPRLGTTAGKAWLICMVFCGVAVHIFVGGSV